MQRLYSPRLYLLWQVHAARLVLTEHAKVQEAAAQVCRGYGSRVRVRVRAWVRVRVHPNPHPNPHPHPRPNQVPRLREQATQHLLVQRALSAEAAQVVSTK